MCKLNCKCLSYVLPAIVHGHMRALEAHFVSFLFRTCLCVKSFLIVLYVLHAQYTLSIKYGVPNSGVRRREVCMFYDLESALVPASQEFMVCMSEMPCMSGL